MNEAVREPQGIILPDGFSFSSTCAGIKASGRPDLAFVEASTGTTGAALFTKNRVVAAPLEVGRAALATTHGRIRAVIINSGNANCATGPSGLKAARLVCAEVARLLHIRSVEVFPSSTGIIGVPLPADKILSKLPELIASSESSHGAADRFAKAILTTDTRAKIASSQLRVGKKGATIFGVAKGSGMIHPQLATMLVYIFTDLAASPSDLKKHLRDCSGETFECISVDGDTSTNDTVLLLASGKSGLRLKDPGVAKKFGNALLQVCHSLADQIVSDGEGAKHIIRLTVEGARSRDEARQIARSISHSLLVKTAWAGSDPNWGRILAAVGYSSIDIDPKRVNVFIGDQLVCKGGVASPFDEQRAHQHLSQPVCSVRVTLGRGRSFIRFTTTDLTAEYVRINADYST